MRLAEQIVQHPFRGVLQRPAGDRDRALPAQRRAQQPGRDIPLDGTGVAGDLDELRRPGQVGPPTDLQNGLPGAIGRCPGDGNTSSPNACASSGSSAWSGSEITRTLARLTSVSQPNRSIASATGTPQPIPVAPIVDDQRDHVRPSQLPGVDQLLRGTCGRVTPKEVRRRDPATGRCHQPFDRLQFLQRLADRRCDQHVAAGPERVDHHLPGPGLRHSNQRRSGLRLEVAMIGPGREVVQLTELAPDRLIRVAQPHDPYAGPPPVHRGQE